MCLGNDVYVEIKTRCMETWPGDLGPKTESSRSGFVVRALLLLRIKYTNKLSPRGLRLQNPPGPV